MERRDEGDDSGSQDRSPSTGSDGDDNDGVVVAFVCGDQEDTSPRKLPDDIKARKTRATTDCDIFVA
jgi:hypothetical protein